MKHLTAANTAKKTFLRLLEAIAGSHSCLAWWLDGYILVLEIIIMR
jgi:hypothetical protein